MDEPITRKELFYSAILGNTAVEDLPEPVTREEVYLKAIAENGGGGGEGTRNYNQLTNKPKVNGVELSGNKTTEDLLPIGDGLQFNEDGELEVTGGGGGSAETEHDVTANMTVGAIASGTTIPQGTSLTSFLERLLITEIAPTTSFTASGSGVKEVGTSVTPTLTLNITSKGTGTPTAIKFYSGSTLLDTQEYVEGTNSYTYTMESAVTTNTTVKGVLEYTKSSGTSATIEKSASYTFVLASYYGAVTTAPTTLGEIQALTKNVKNTKALTATFTLNNQRSCYAYPSSFGNLTSIKDANNFEYISSYTKTTVGDYVVYTLTDPVTASGFKQVYA